MRDETATRPARSDPWPKHHQVYLVLLQQITEGRFGEDGTMPNELQLAQSFSVSRITIRKAMERLEAEGLIERHRGRGTFARPGRRASPVHASISGTIENLIAMGLKTHVRVVSLDYVAASPHVAGALGIEKGATVQKAVRLRSHEGSNFSHLTTYVPEDIGRSFGEADLRANPLLVLLERSGARIARAKQMITATLATPEIAALLETDAGSALLSIKRVVYDRSGRPLEYIEGLYRPDTYEHQIDFERRKGGDGPFWDIDLKRR